ncbi:MAG: glutamine synthetase [Acidaminococcaceae bacterium]|nr:glutamine synthetase [Acidaminococcaceae bacterium]
MLTYRDIIMNKDALLYVITPEKQNREDLLKLLKEHQEIKFVSLMGVDFAGNDTDEKIPIKLFIDDMHAFLEGSAAQTDGSSVVLPGIATLNDARVDMQVDRTVNWYVDYNYEHFDAETGKMVGTLRIPCFLLHNGKLVDSRSILRNTFEYVSEELKKLFRKYPQVAGLEHLKLADIDKFVFTTATELEFWVKTPAEDAPIEALSSSQMMQEQYWQRTRGNVRTALEQTLEMLERYGLEPEMGHKECGGVRGHIDSTGHMTHVMEQLEIDWKYNSGLQPADNEILARIVVKEIFRLNGLEVSFQAKPIPGVAGSGEHTHVGIAARMKDGRKVNLFAPTKDDEAFLSAVGFGAIMGILKNYEVLNPFISCTNDSLNRLQPGFEAPVCIVTSLGTSPEQPSRNRTVLAGLIRDLGSPLATRIEMRSPNPYTNTYIAIAIFYLAALDGIKACVTAKKSLAQLENEISKKAGKSGFYLEKERQYRTEDDVFEDFNAAERAKLFGEPPATVWENMQALKKYPEKVRVLTAGDILPKPYIDSFVEGVMIRWRTEILTRILPEARDLVVACKQLHNDSAATTKDKLAWKKIDRLRRELVQDKTKDGSLISKMRKALNEGKYDVASQLLLTLKEKTQLLTSLYHRYQQNILL